MAVTIFSIAEKFLGFIYRIYLSRALGSEGVGIYHIALSVFAVLLTLSCSGTPITVSRMMAKYRAKDESAKVQQAISAGLLLTLIIALPLFLIMFFGHNLFGFLFTDERCMAIFLIILPALLFNAVYAVLRGVFWGNKNFLPYSAIELLEEIVMIVFGIILVSTATSVFDGAKKATIAVVVSYVFSCAAALIFFFTNGGRLKNPKSQMIPLISSAMPVTAMRTANSIINSLVAVILPLRLVAAGMTSAEALSAFGVAFGMAMPLLFIPSTIIGSFTLVLIPEISENFYKRKTANLKRDIEKAFKTSIFAACLFIPIFMALGEELGSLIYANHTSGIYLSFSAFLMLPMGLSSISTSVLNSLGLEKKTLLFYVIGAALMLLSVWFLPKYFGIYSLIIGFALIFGLTTILNLILISKKSGAKPNYLKFLALSLCMLLPTLIFGFLLKNLIIKYLGDILTIAIITVVLIITTLILGAVFGLYDFKKYLKKLALPTFHFKPRHKGKNG